MKDIERLRREKSDVKSETSSLTTRSGNSSRRTRPSTISSSATTNGSYAHWAHNQAMRNRR